MSSQSMRTECRSMSLCSRSGNKEIRRSEQQANRGYYFCGHLSGSGRTHCGCNRVVQVRSGKVCTARGSKRVFGWIFRKMDAVSRRMLLGETAKKRARHLLANNPDFSQHGAEQLATAEALVSMRAEGLDITSSAAVREWSSRFLLTPIKDNSEHLRVLSESEKQSSY